MTRLLLSLLLLATPAVADPPPLGLPIDCRLGDDCFLMNYFDSDPGPGATDFTCGPQSYDGHQGTDFAVPSFAAMRAGVAVLAAAPGEVRATRDGMPDLGLEGTPAAALEGKDCGNGVVIDHGGGWETQYCHLRADSVAVAEGDRVEAGDRLGLVGFSGMTQFPHVHLSVRHDGVEIDPFDTDGARVCGADDGPGDDLWAQPPGYSAGGIVAAGLSPGLPDYAAVQDGTAGPATLPRDAPALVGWVLLHGGRAGDEVEIVLRDPADAVFDRFGEVLDRTQAMVMRAAGRRQPDGGWVPGVWRVETRLIRDGAVLDSAEAVTELR